jgi:hypothetical protein
MYIKNESILFWNKMPPDYISSTTGFITSNEQVNLNDWSPWTVTEDKFEFTTESQVDAFLEIAEKKASSN